MAEERDDKIEAVKKVNRALTKTASHEELVERIPPNKEHFQSLMNAEKDPSIALNTNSKAIEPGQAPPPVENISAEQTTRNNKDLSDIAHKNQKASDPIVAASPVDKIHPSSLMDEVKRLNTRVKQAGQLSPLDLKTQARELIAQIEDAKLQLANAKSELKPSYQTLMRNRLTHVDESLKIALSKAGVEYVPPPQANAGKGFNPFERFIGYLTHGQYQLEHLSQTIEHLNLTQAQLTPANMLAIQIKVGQVQQEIELFTSLLNKALESTKTIMNVQV